MKTFDNESFILENFKLTPLSKVISFGNYFKCRKIYKIIEKKKWIYSSSKQLPPPDFYIEKYKLMMEVMSINDTAYDDNGKSINPEKRKEKEILRYYLGNNYKKERDDISVYVNADVTNFNNSYDKYLDNFKRVFKKHKDKISLYKKNHENYKLIFFIFDESPSYIEVHEQYKNEIYKARPHIAFMDKRFIDIFIESNIQYLVWFAPYKQLFRKNGKSYKLPQIAIYDIESLKDKKFIDYDINKMKVVK